MRPFPLDPQLDPHAAEIGEIEPLLGLGQGQDQLAKRSAATGPQLAVDGRFAALRHERRDRVTILDAIVLRLGGEHAIGQDVQPALRAEFEQHNGLQADDQQQPEQQVGHTKIGWGHGHNTYNETLTRHPRIRRSPVPEALLHAPPGRRGRLAQPAAKSLGFFTMKHSMPWKNNEK
ncbi:hypothetical protein D3C79_649460 [compost metagenome]